MAKQGFHVMVIGAGSAGLLLAHGLNKAFYEREQFLNERKRDWNFGIYWAQNHLAECLPPEILSRMKDAQVDPQLEPSDKDNLTLANGDTSTVIKTVPIPFVNRLARSKFRALIAAGVHIEYGKRLRSVEAGAKVKAVFEDGSTATGDLLVGADGAKSRVRDFLVGPEKAALEPLPIVGLTVITNLSAEMASKIRKEFNKLSTICYTSVGLVTFTALHTSDDQSDPGSWQWMLNFTRKDFDESILSASAAVLYQTWNSWAEALAEPFRSVFRSIPEDQKIWCEQLGQWPTTPWDDRAGKVTLVGDAAHPMTYHRGQGLNNAVEDAAKLAHTVSEYVKSDGGKSLQAIIEAYEAEMVPRGREAVISSGQNSMMVHDKEKLMQSGMLTIGLKKDQQ